jgi:hypothetical protein
MPALVAGIHAFLQVPVAGKAWMAGTSPAMTGSDGPASQKNSAAACSAALRVWIERARDARGGYCAVVTIDDW